MNLPVKIYFSTKNTIIWVLPSSYTHCLWLGSHFGAHESVWSYFFKAKIITKTDSPQKIVLKYWKNAQKSKLRISFWKISIFMHIKVNYDS
jgi:hypothetical protein